MIPIGLHSGAHAALTSSCIVDKLARTNALYAAWRAGKLTWDEMTPVLPICRPGRPERPLLVPPNQVARRQLSTLDGRVALVHSIAHIEFNAVNLALDAVYRFHGMPEAYYGDWLKVAAEEACHFTLLAGRLAELGASYGDVSAHNGLWEMAVKTGHDVLVRMALVPRILEARGLDVTPGIQKRLRQCGDTVTADLLDIILCDEIGHVAIGNHWYRQLCEQRGLEPVDTFRHLYREYGAPMISQDLNRDARRRAGFDEIELQLLTSLSIGNPAM